MEKKEDKMEKRMGEKEEKLSICLRILGLTRCQRE